MKQPDKYELITRDQYTRNLMNLYGTVQGISSVTDSKEPKRVVLEHMKYTKLSMSRIKSLKVVLRYIMQEGLG